MYHSYTSKQSDDAITFDEFINGEFSYSTFNGSWWSDTELQWENSVRDDVTSINPPPYDIPLLLLYYFGINKNYQF